MRSGTWKSRERTCEFIWDSISIGSQHPHMSVEPEDESLRELCGRICNSIRSVSSLDSTFLPVTRSPPPPDADDLISTSGEIFGSVSSHLSIMHQFWLYRVMPQKIWRWSHSQDSTIAYNPSYRSRSPRSLPRAMVRPSPSSKQTAFLLSQSPWDLKLAPTISVPRASST